MKTVKSASEKIEVYIRWFLESLATDKVSKGIRFTMEFWSILSRDPSKDNIAKERYAKFEQDLEQLLLEGVQSGEFSDKLDTKTAVYLILTTLDGIGFTDAVMGIKSNKIVITEYIKMILNYLKGEIL